MSINSIFLKPFGLKLSRIVEAEKFTHDEVFMSLYDQCKPYTMTTIERMFALYQAVNYVVKYDISGDFVECGVWRGGSSMMIALVLAKLGCTDRQLHLYDTFEGMSEPTKVDVTYRGDDAELLMQKSMYNKETSVWCLADISDVKNNMALTGYNPKNIHYVKGKVEDTIPGNIPSNGIALLRLDTDFYESTAHELEYFYPMLIQGGVLIIDDYGHWDGCKKAVDEYFVDKPILLNRIDYTGRISVKA
jgi:hypothetical protein